MEDLNNIIIIIDLTQQIGNTHSFLKYQRAFTKTSEIVDHKETFQLTKK